MLAVEYDGNNTVSAETSSSKDVRTLEPARRLDSHQVLADPKGTRRRPWFGGFTLTSRR